MNIICMDCHRECGDTEKHAQDAAATESADSTSTSVTHGLCVRCYAIRLGAIPTDELRTWVDADLNRLPTGKIILDQDLRVIGYSKEEEALTGLLAEEIMGKDFFADVAPCMDGAELSEWCAQNVSHAELQEKSIDWLLTLRAGERVATLEMCAGQGRVAILVEVTGHGAA